MLRVEKAGFEVWLDPAVESGSYRFVRLLPEGGSTELAVRFVDPSGAGIAGVQTLLSVDPYDHPSQARDTDVSGPDGSTVVQVPKSGRWWLYARGPGYQSWHNELPDLSAWPRVDWEITLEPGFGVRGQVRSSDGAELAAATVVIETLGMGPPYRLDCDENGFFDTGPVLRAGVEVEVTGRAPGYGERRVVRELKEADIVEGGFELILELEPGDVSLVGRVVEAGGRPLRATVLLKPMSGATYVESMMAQHPIVGWRAVAESDEQGHFRVRGLAARQGYEVMAVPCEPFVDVGAIVPPLEPGAQHDLGELVPAVGGTLFGFVRRWDGRQVPHHQLSTVSVSAISAEESSDPGFVPASLAGGRSALTNRNGRFEITCLPASESHELYVDREGAKRRLVDTYEVADGEAVGPIEIVLPRPEDVAEVKLAGLVVDPDGQALDSIYVQAWVGPEVSVAEGVRLAEAAGAGRSSEAGTFEIDGLVGGQEYRLTAVDLFGRHQRYESWVTAESERERLRIEMWPSGAPPGTVKGRVRDTSGAPLAGVELTFQPSLLVVRCSCAQRTTTSDAEGRFSFGTAFGGMHQVFARDPQGRYGPASSEARPGEPVELVLR